MGLLVGTGAIVIPGIGALIAAGTLAALAAGAATGGVVGGAIGLLTGHGISNADSHLYAEGLKRGGTLVTVAADDDRLDAFREIFKKHGAVDIEKRGAHWEAEGWVAFDPDQPHPTPEELAAHRRRPAPIRSNIIIMSATISIPATAEISDGGASERHRQPLTAEDHGLSGDKRQSRAVSPVPTCRSPRNLPPDNSRPYRLVTKDESYGRAGTWILLNPIW